MSFIIVAQMSANDYIVPLSESLLRRLEKVAAENGVPVDELVQIAVSQWLEKQGYDNTDSLNSSAPAANPPLLDDGA